MRVFIVCISILSVSSLNGQVLLTPGGTVGTSPDGTVRVSNTSVLASNVIDDNNSPDNAVRLLAHWWPNSDSERDLGSSSLKWRNLFLSSNANIFGNVGIGGSASANTKLVLTHSANAPYVNAFQITSNNLNTHWPLVISTNGLGNQSGFVSDSDGDIYLLLRDKNGNADVQLNSEGYNYINGGNLGIRTVTPQHALQVGDAVAPVSLSLRGPDNNASGSSLVFEDVNGTAGQWFKFVNNTIDNKLTLQSPEKPAIMSFNRIDGRIGIGTTTPNETLHVKGRTYLEGTEYYEGGWSKTFLNWKGHSLIMGAPVGTYGHSQIELKSGGATNGQLHTFFSMFTTPSPNVYEEKIHFSTASHSYINSGNVGIGTTTPDAKLTVKGTIHTQEVRVDLLGAVAPDYVFEPTYELKSLSEVESYIKQHKHLPEVPSAKEMETNGINLSEMNMLLLKKVEELTLYVIELKKENEKQNEVIKTLLNK